MPAARCFVTGGSPVLKAQRAGSAMTSAQCVPRWLQLLSDMWGHVCDRCCLTAIWGLADLQGGACWAWVTS